MRCARLGAGVAAARAQALRVALEEHAASRLAARVRRRPAGEARGLLAGAGVVEMGGGGPALWGLGGLGRCVPCRPPPLSPHPRHGVLHLPNKTSPRHQRAVPREPAADATPVAPLGVAEEEAGGPAPEGMDVEPSPAAGAVADGPATAAAQDVKMEEAAVAREPEQFPTTATCTDRAGPAAATPPTESASQSDRAPAARPPPTGSGPEQPALGERDHGDGPSPAGSPGTASEQQASEDQSKARKRRKKRSKLEALAAEQAGGDPYALIADMIAKAGAATAAAADKPANLRSAVRAEKKQQKQKAQRQ